jgi:hypothetical protein
MSNQQFSPPTSGISGPMTSPHGNATWSEEEETHIKHQPEPRKRYSFVDIPSQSFSLSTTSPDPNEVFYCSCRGFGEMQTKH